MKKRILLMGVAAALVTTAFIGGSLAYFQAGSGSVQQQINTKTLNISLSDSVSGEPLIIGNAMPGEIIDLDHKYTVKNTGNTALYVRVTVSKSWGDYKDDVFVKMHDKDDTLMQLKTGNEWYIMENNDGNEENVYLYYRKPLKTWEETSSILQDLEVAETLTNAYTDKGIQLEIEAEAVQASSVSSVCQDAILAEWGIWAEIDQAGNIISIEE